MKQLDMAMAYYNSSFVSGIASTGLKLFGVRNENFYTGNTFIRTISHLIWI